MKNRLMVTVRYIGRHFRNNRRGKKNIARGYSEKKIKNKK